MIALHMPLSLKIRLNVTPQNPSPPRAFSIIHTNPDLFTESWSSIHHPFTSSRQNCFIHSRDSASSRTANLMNPFALMSYENETVLDAQNSTDLVNIDVLYLITRGIIYANNRNGNISLHGACCIQYFVNTRSTFNRQPFTASPGDITRVLPRAAKQHVAGQSPLLFPIAARFPLFPRFTIPRIIMPGIDKKAIARATRGPASRPVDRSGELLGEA